MPLQFIKITNRFISFAFLFFIIVFSYAQPSEQFVKVVVAPDHNDWTYKTGENVKFTISILQNGNLLKNAVVKYEMGPEKMELQKKDSLSLREGTLVVDAGTMKEPGFLRCIAIAIVNGKSYRGLATAAFNPLMIEPAIVKPDDFTAFLSLIHI